MGVPKPQLRCMTGGVPSDPRKEERRFISLLEFMEVVGKLRGNPGLV
jgi:hypothetical protein